MMRSMFSGVSGLKNHQAAMDVVGNNISNVNTTAFKSSRVSFHELFNQTMRGASAPTEESGGTNPVQIGLGMGIASVDTIQEQGSMQNTGRNTDMAVQGSGFFVVNDGAQNSYTRAGAFSQDGQGYLIDPAGNRLQGWDAVDGTFDNRTQQNMTDIQVPEGSTIAAQATDTVVLGDNLDADAADLTTRTISVDALDSVGNVHQVEIEFTRDESLDTGSTSAWHWQATEPSGLGIMGEGEIHFDTAGQVDEAASSVITDIEFDPDNADMVTVDLDYSQVTQYGAETTLQMIDRNGFASGELQEFTVDGSGVVTGVYSNGETRPLAQVALASFSNPAGLTKQGENLYMSSNNSGQAQIGAAGTGDRGDVMPGSLEMSNVDLPLEFTNMITTQRGFQANSRVITTSDEMLQELVNLKR